MNIIREKILYFVTCGIFLMNIVSCNNDDDLSVSSLNPVIAFVPGSIVEGFTEGDTINLQVGYFGSDTVTEVTANYAITGAINRTGTVTIPAGALTANIEITVSDDLIVNGAREFAVSLTDGSIALNDVSVNPILPITIDSIGIADDVITFGVTGDTLNVIEGEEATIPLGFTGSGDIDEVLTISYSIDVVNTTAVAGDYSITPSSPFTWDPEVDTLEEFPSLKITFTDDLATNPSDTLVLKVGNISVSGSDEVVLSATTDNFIEYRFVDDLKTVGFSMDTVYLDSSAIASASNIITAELTVDREVLSDAGVTYVTPAPLTIDGIGFSIFSPGTTTSNVRIDASGLTFNPSNAETDTTYFTLEIAGFAAVSNSDTELRVDSEKDSYVIGVIDPE